VRVRGTTHAARQEQAHAMEVHAKELDVLGASDAAAYPIRRGREAQPLPFLRRNAHLRARAQSMTAILRLRSALSFAVHDFFRSREYLEVQAPLMTSSDCEGAGETFRVRSPSDTPDSEPKRYLSVSSQLHLEALASCVSRVYTLAPAFRAEESDTARHLQEFWMLEAEESFLAERTPEALEQVMSLVEDCVRTTASRAFAREPDALAFFDQQRPGLADSLDKAIGEKAAQWTRLSYADAVRELIAYDESAAGTDKFHFTPALGKALQTEHEQFLAESVCGGRPVFICDYPAAVKPFYMLPTNASDDVAHDQAGGQAGTVANFDLVLPRVGELAGGSLREHREQALLQSLEAHGLDKEAYDWYVDLRRFGTARHGGFGMGWERLVCWLSGMPNVRECIPFPRASESSRF